MRLVNRLFVVAVLVLVVLHTVQAEESLTVADMGHFRMGGLLTIGKSNVNGQIGGKDISFGEKRHFTIGPTLYIDYLISNGLALGTKYRALFQLEDVAFHDIDGVIKFVFLQDYLARSEFYLSLPIGYSVMTDRSKIFGTGKGFNVGAGFGGHYFINNNLGFNFEVGYTYRRIKTKVNNDVLAHHNLENAAFNFHEFGLNIGVALRF